jgi:hypothetical protein
VHAVIHMNPKMNHIEFATGAILAGLSANPKLF